MSTTSNICCEDCGREAEWYWIIAKDNRRVCNACHIVDSERQKGQSPAEYGPSPLRKAYRWLAALAGL